MAAHNVFDNQDLLKNVLGFFGWYNDLGLLFGIHDNRFVGCACDLHREMVFRERLRQLLRAASVNRLFRTVAMGLVEELWTMYQEGMASFDKAADEYLEYMEPPFYALSTFARADHCVWPRMVYNFDCQHLPWGDSQDLLDLFQKYARPTKPKELLRLLERQCACCDAVCERMRYPPDSYNVSSDALGAWMHHPYRGETRDGPSAPGCTCRTHYLQGRYVPHTCHSHFFDVAFMHDDGIYKAQLRIHGDTMTREERRMSWFLVGARKQEWYQPRIKRLFDLRPFVTWEPKPCCPAWRSALRKCPEPYPGFRPKCEFDTSICLLEPRMLDNDDCSVQQIFGLTREETLALVRRGRLILRERHNLRTGY